MVHTLSLGRPIRLRIYQGSLLDLMLLLLAGWSASGTLSWLWSWYGAAYLSSAQWLVVECPSPQLRAAYKGWTPFHSRGVGVGWRAGTPGGSSHRCQPSDPSAGRSDGLPAKILLSLHPPCFSRLHGGIRMSPMAGKAA